MRPILILTALAVIPAIAGAQSSRPEEEPTSSLVPVNMMPPAGKCRIWMVGVAPEQQPAPTDCQTALRQRTTNGVVIFGPMERDENVSAFRGRPTPERGLRDRPRTSTARESRAGSSSETTRETLRQPGSQPATAPAEVRERAETRSPATSETRRESPARPPASTPRPPAEPVKKPTSERPQGDGASTAAPASIAERTY